MYVMVWIVGLVVWVLIEVFYYFVGYRNAVSSNVHGTLLEIVWTLVPGFILLLISVPSFGLLYGIEEYVKGDITVKIVGHQWFWVYEISLGNTEVSFDSYMVNTEDLMLGELRLLEVDNRLYLPVGVHIRMIMTAGDVLHSWAVPALGVKVDCCPGRLNEISVFINREGTYYGQCSELCGINHAFMPIAVDALNPSLFVRALVHYL